MGMADDAEETPVAYGPTPGRANPPPSDSELRTELAYIDFEIDAWAQLASSADEAPPDDLLRRKFEISRALGLEASDE